MGNYAFIDDATTNDLCDRIELRLWAGAAGMSIDTLQHELRDGLASDDDAYEDAIAAIGAMAARRALLGDAYPYTVHNGVASFEDTGIGGNVYVFCTALAILDHTYITPKARGYTFELVAMEAAANYFAAPLRFPTGATSHLRDFSSYEELLRQVAQAVVELRDPIQLTRPGGGDAGWDFLVVKPFCDGGYARMVIGGNCATGQTDWLQKGSETVFEHWFRYFFDDRKLHGPYVEVLAAPFIADSDERSRKTGSRTMLLDRFRIAEHSRYVGDDLISWLESVRVPASDLPLR